MGERDPLDILAGCGDLTERPSPAFATRLLADLMDDLMGDLVNPLTHPDRVRDPDRARNAVLGDVPRPEVASAASRSGSSPSAVIGGAVRDPC